MPVYRAQYAITDQAIAATPVLGDLLGNVCDELVRKLAKRMATDKKWAICRLREVTVEYDPVRSWTVVSASWNVDASNPWLGSEAEWRTFTLGELVMKLADQLDARNRRIDAIELRRKVSAVYSGTVTWTSNNTTGTQPTYPTVTYGVGTTTYVGPPAFSPRPRPSAPAPKPRKPGERLIELEEE